MEKSLGSLCGVILAGGQSSRMGRRKELLAWQKKTLIEHLVGCVTSLAIPCLVVTNEPQQLPDTVKEDANVQVSGDLVEPCGPLGGIITSFRLRLEERVLLLSCDLPFLTPSELTRFCSYQTQGDDWDVILAQSQKRLHPLLGIYHRRTQPIWEEAWINRQYRLMTTLEKLRVHAVPEGLLDPWTTYNANTPEEYSVALAEWSRRHNE